MLVGAAVIVQDRDQKREGEEKRADKAWTERRVRASRGGGCAKETKETLKTAISPHNVSIGARLLSHVVMCSGPHPPSHNMLVSSGMH